MDDFPLQNNAAQYCSRKHLVFRIQRLISVSVDERDMCDHNYFESGVPIIITPSQVFPS